MKHVNDIYKQLLTPLCIGLFVVGCSSGGGDGDANNNIITEDNAVPVAAAGADLVVSRNFTVNLDGSQSNDADGDDLTYTWVQKAGPDVTGGTGSLRGVAPAFQAPGEVDTIILDLVVNDGQEDSVADTVMVNVFEDQNVTYFVDGDNGSDLTGNGSQETPYASIAKALCEITQEQQDVYVMSRTGGGVYDESIDPCPGDPTPRNADEILAIPTGTSLYGGYDENWVRNAATNLTSVVTLHHGFRFASVDLNAWFSGFKVQADNSPGPENSVHAVTALGGIASIFIYNNQLTAGNVGFGAAANPGTSYGLLVAHLDGATIERNIITAGFGGDGLDAANISGEAPAGSAGVEAAGGDGKGVGDHDGGNGGAGGTGLGSNGSKGGDGQGPSGGTGGTGGAGNTSDNGSPGGQGGGGDPGAGGAGGSGSGSLGVYEDGGSFASFIPGKGSTGATGIAGSGGGGGGGGEASTVFGVNGGAGGGGGGGGAGGAGGNPGPGGGASIGLLIAAISNSVIKDNEIASGTGGNGAKGGMGQIGGDGGAFGTGANGNTGAGTGGDGGNGGAGGKGGTGGIGGAGGGGPSYGIVIGQSIAPTISNNAISSGDGGNGGFGGAKGHGGDGGNSYSVFDSDINDGIVPALTNNALNFGLPGNGGGTTGTGGSIGDAGMSGTRNW